MKKTLLISGIVLVLLAALAAWFTTGITDVRVEQTRITGIKDVTSNSLTVVGDITLHNPSRLSVPISGVPYTVTVRETGTVIAQGELDGFTLNPHTSTTTPFTITVGVRELISSLPTLLLKSEVFFDLDAQVRVAPLPGFTYELALHQEKDVKEDLPRSII